MAGSERSIPHLRDIFGWEEKLSDAGDGKKKKQQRCGRSDHGSDVKHLERHLSMKKTIRKKIMRDLQQAFVEDPDEFRVEDISPEQLKAEINVQSLSFGGPQKKAAPEPTFLDMLRGGGRDEDSGHGSPSREVSEDVKKTSFWRRFTVKNRNKR